MFIMERIISLVAPHECRGCGREGSLLCAWCQADLLSPLPERCYRCRKLSAGFATCPACRKTSRLKHLWPVVMYEGLAKDLLHGFKFERQQAAAQPMATMMRNSLPYLGPGVIITHVPTAGIRRRQRGYDQAELLAKALANKLNIRYARVLGRLGTSRQVGAKRQQRLSQLQNAFLVFNEATIKGRAVLLVDDIVTTGASLEAAAKALRQAGAKSVDAVVFAQKQ